MPIDARISMGLRPQTYDAFAAYDTGRQNEQTFRTNQMAQQAAQATAARNAMIQQRAAQTDFNDPASVRNFAALGPGTEDYLSSVTAGDTMFTSRDTNRRAESEARIKQDEAGMVELRTVVGRVFANPDDASLADAAQRYPQFAADINRIAANPDAAARRTGLATLVASLPGGSEFLDAVTQEYTNVDLGGTTQRVPNRTYLPGEVQSFTKTPDPTPKTQLVQLADGTFTVVNLGTGQGTTATLPGGTPAVGRVPGAAPAADAGRAAAATTLRDALSQLRTNFGTLYQRGFMRGEGVRPAGNVAQYVRDRVPLLRGLQLAGDAEAATASDSIDTLLSTAVSTLSSLYGTSSRVMDAVKEMENVRKSFGSETMTYEAAVNAVDTVMRRVDELEAEQGGGDVSAIEAEARRRGLIP